jgi:hypothetical protein
METGMADSERPAPQLTFERLAELRRKTEAISKFLQDQLLTHLETLRPILAPDRVLGKYAGTRGDSPLAERALAQLQQSYKPFAARPFDLPSELDPHWLTLVGTKVTLYPWEYLHELKTDRENRTVSMSSPVRWVLSYSSGYTLSQLRQGLAGKGERRPEHVRQFVVNALVTQLVITHTPGLAPLLTDLRYELRTEYASDLPKLPLTTITSGLPSFRPADDLILSATSFSGVPAFIEVIEIDALAELHDPLQMRIEELLR